MILHCVYIKLKCLLNANINIYLYFRTNRRYFHDDVIKWDILVLLPLCEGNPPVTAGFPSQKPVTPSFDVFFDRRLNKQPRRRWFETLSCSLWRHCNFYNKLKVQWPYIQGPSNIATCPHNLHIKYSIFIPWGRDGGCGLRVESL